MEWIRDTGLVLTILGLVGVGGALLLAILRVLYIFSPVSRARRAMRRAVRDPQDLLDSIADEHAGHEQKLDAAMKVFLAAQKAERAENVPVESLKAEGARRVRWNALREAGFTNLAEVARSSVKKLAAIRGVGEATAPRILEAAEAGLDRIDQMPPDLPTPELAEEGSVDVGREAVNIIRVRDAVHPSHDVVKREFATIENEASKIWEDTRFGRWVLRRTQGEDETPGERARKCIDRVSSLRGSDAFLQLSTSWKVFPKRRKRAKDDEVREQATLRYPEVCAICEESFDRLGHPEARRSSAVRGGLPEEIAGRVANFELECDGLDVILRGYQKFGAQYILEQKRTVLGDEMGLGKTIEALAAMTHRWSEHPARRFLVIAPAGLVWNWAREASTRAPFPVHVLHGDELEDGLAKWHEENGLAVTSYATLRNLASKDGKLDAIDEIDLLVADEAHYLKNPDAGRTKAALTVIGRASLVCLMTGTPQENHPSEFLSLIRIAQPAVAGRLNADGDFLDEAFGVLGQLHERFSEQVAQVYLRRNQADVLSELPECIEVDEWVDLGAEERDAYANAVAEGNFMAMRRATAVDGDGKTSAKLDHLEELLVDHRSSDRKVIVFSYFLDVLGALDRRFGALGTISGETPPKDRMELVDAFHGVPGHAILLCQIESAGQGLNLQCASAVVIVEPQLKPTTEDQAIARAHRMGQTQPVVVHRLLARETVDEHLTERLAEKRELFDAFARESAVTSASDEAKDTGFAEEVIGKERERLGLKPDPASEKA